MSAVTILLSSTERVNEIKHARNTAMRFVKKVDCFVLGFITSIVHVSRLEKISALLNPCSDFLKQTKLFLKRMFFFQNVFRTAKKNLLFIWMVGSSQMAILAPVDFACQNKRRKRIVPSACQIKTDLVSQQMRQR